MLCVRTCMCCTKAAFQAEGPLEQCRVNQPNKVDDYVSVQETKKDPKSSYCCFSGSVDRPANTRGALRLCFFARSLERRRMDREDQTRWKGIIVARANGLWQRAKNKHSKAVRVWEPHWGEAEINEKDFWLVIGGVRKCAWELDHAARWSENWKNLVPNFLAQSAKLKEATN